MKGFLRKFKAFVVRNASYINFECSVVIVFCIVFGLIIMNCVVPTSSMYPTIEPGDRVIGNRLAYVFDTPEYGDMVVFTYPDNPKAKFFKRVIGTPGDVVEIKNNTTYINNKIIVEEYCAEDIEDNFGPYYVPKKNDVVTLTDVKYNENNEIIRCDCFINDYYVGFVAEAKYYDSFEQKQKQEFIDFLGQYCEYVDGQYIIKENLYFCMGDNRNNSHDSRYWAYRYVPESEILAKYLFSFG
ncbi:MAG: signal peptidase I [Candidatus Gastranaerophilaceae bacterium]